MRQNKEPDIQLPESLWITSVSSLDSHYSRGCDFSPLLFLHFVTKRRDICLSFIDEIQPFRLGRKHDSDINKKKKTGAERRAADYVFITKGVCVAESVSPVAVGHDQTVWLSAGLLALPGLQSLLACPAPPLAGRFFLIIINPSHPGKGNIGKTELEDNRLFFTPKFNLHQFRSLPSIYLCGYKLQSEPFFKLDCNHPSDQTWCICPKPFFLPSPIKPTCQLCNN